MALLDTGSPLTVAGAAPGLLEAHRIPILAGEVSRQNHAQHMGYPARLCQQVVLVSLHGQS